MATAEDWIEYACVRAVLDHPLARVWRHVGRFGELDRWVDGVTACSVEGAGLGAVRTVTRNGAVVRERLDRFDADAHELSYLILEPHALPASDVRGTITLRATESGATEMVWCSVASQFRAPPQALGERIERFYSASIQGLGRLLDASRDSPDAEAAIDVQR